MEIQGFDKVLILWWKKNQNQNKTLTFKCYPHIQTVSFLCIVCSYKKIFDKYSGPLTHDDRGYTLALSSGQSRGFGKLGCQGAICWIQKSLLETLVKSVFMYFFSYFRIFLLHYQIFESYYFCH